MIIAQNIQKTHKKEQPIVYLWYIHIMIDFQQSETPI